MMDIPIYYKHSVNSLHANRLGEKMCFFFLSLSRVELEYESTADALSYN